MSQFSEQLRLTCDRLKLTRTDLANAAGIPPNTMVQYALGRRSPTPGVIAAICAALPAGEASLIAIARLRDELPPECSHLVSIAATTGAPGASPALTLPVLSNDLRAAFEQLANEAVLSPETRDLILSLARVLCADTKPLNTSSGFTPYGQALLDASPATLDELNAGLAIASEAMAAEDPPATAYGKPVAKTRKAGR